MVMGGYRSVHYTCRYFFSLKFGSHHTDEVITNNNNLPLAVEDMSWITILIELCYKYGKQLHVADGDIFLAPGFIPHLCTVHVKMVTKFKPLDLHSVLSHIFVAVHVKMVTNLKPLISDYGTRFYTDQMECRLHNHVLTLTPTLTLCIKVFIINLYPRLKSIYN